MPKHQQIIPVNGADTDNVLSVCMSCFKQLGWTLAFAGDDRLAGYAASSWKSKQQEIIATVTANQLTVSSEMAGEELFDIAGKNKKNVTDLINRFELVRQSITPAENIQNIAAINELRSATASTFAEEEAHAAEFDKAFNIKGSNLYVTYSIIAINIIVFIAKAFDGAGLLVPNGLVHVRWGSDFAPLTLGGEWWRLITSTFIHFGILHLALNMYCLYNIGTFLEPMLGKLRFIVVYLCTGIAAGIASLWWHTTPINSAGASGAIFGMYGLFLSFLTTSLIPEKTRKTLLQSIAMFIFYNLFLGLRGKVDNAGHIGGLLSGIITGYLLVPVLKKEREKLQLLTWITPAVGVLTAGLTFFTCNNTNGPQKKRHR